MSRNAFPGARFALFLLIAIGIGRDVGATIPDWSLRDYVQTTWTHRDGLSLSRLSNLTQTTDGYLWFLSARTLIRFDGMRFVPMPAPCDEPHTLEPGVDGNLWLLCRQPRIQLFRRDTAGRFTEIPLTGLPFRGGPALLHDSRGRIWISDNSLVGRLESDGTFREFRGDFNSGVLRSAEDTAGIVWFTNGHKIVRIRDDLVEYLPIGRVSGFVAAPSGGVFACGPGDRIRHLTGLSETVIAQAPSEVEFVPSSQCMAVDASGRIWAATRQHGIALVQSGRVETAVARNEAGATVTAVFVDREDTVWVGSSVGLHRFRKPYARLLSSMVVDVPPDPKAVFVDSRQDIWITNMFQEFVRMNLTSRNSQIFALPGSDYPVFAFGEDETGRIWLSRERNIGYLERGTFRPVHDATGAPVKDVRAFTKDGSGHLWAVAQGIGIYQVTPGPPRRVFDEPDAAVDLLISSRHGVCVTLDGGGFKQYLAGRQHVFRYPEPTRVPRAILEDDDVIWMGDDRALLRWRGGRWTRWTRAHGLPGTGAVTEITRDRAGRLWLMSEGGILVLSREDLDATPDGAPRSLRFVQIGTMDRVLPHPPGPVVSPRIGVDRDGRLYFATFDSVAIVDPRDVNPSSLQPSIVLESLTADNQSIDVAVTRRLTAPSTLQFRYTSLSLRSPETIRFRYRLEGYDDEWVEAGNAREVTYGTLAPGRYRFHVIGSGSEGVWNEEGAAFAFQIVPLFYYTWWFRAFTVAIVCSAIGGMYRLRVRRLTQQMHIRFEERLAERTRIARDLHDTLLQGTIAASMHAQVANDALTDNPKAIDEALPPLRRAIQLLSRVADEGRATVSGLRAAHTSADIAEMFHRTAKEQPNYGQINFKVVLDGAARPLKPEIVDELSRVVCEAVINAYKHAQARHIEVELIYGKARFGCVVRDDGHGIDEGLLQHGNDGHWGLTGMRERAERAGAELHVRSRAAAGTEVELTVPGRLAYDT